jgi:hypothetical protein
MTAQVRTAGAQAEWRLVYSFRMEYLGKEEEPANPGSSSMGVIDF